MPCSLPCLVLTLEPHCSCVLSATGTWPGCSLCLECSLQALLILLHLGQFLLCLRCQPTSSRPLLSELKPTVLWPENVGYISLCELFVQSSSWSRVSMWDTWYTDVHFIVSYIFILTYTFISYFKIWTHHFLPPFLFSSSSQVSSLQPLPSLSNW